MSTSNSDELGFVTAEVFPGKTNALVKNLMWQMKIDDPNEAVRRINAGEWVVVQRDHHWRERDGVIYFSVTSDGMTGPEWIERLEKKGFRISDCASNVLRSSEFKPTSDVTTEVAVLKGMLFNDEERVTRKIRAEAVSRNLADPNAEVACLIRETFSDEEIEAMGLWWIMAMHEPIEDSDGDPNLLSADREGDGLRLETGWGSPVSRWDRDSGFAFVVSQVSSGD